MRQYIWCAEPYSAEELINNSKILKYRLRGFTMKKLIVALLLVVTMFSNTALAFSFSFDDLDDLVGSVTSMFAPDSTDAYGPMEKVELDDYTIELVNVLECTSSQFYEIKDGYEYVIIEFEFENKGREDLFLSSIMNFNTWCDGEVCTISLEALGTAMFLGKTQLDCVIEPGESFTGVIGYEVPQDWDEIIVQFRGDSIISKSVDFAVSK